MGRQYHICAHPTEHKDAGAADAARRDGGEGQGEGMRVLCCYIQKKTDPGLPERTTHPTAFNDVEALGKRAGHETPMALLNGVKSLLTQTATEEDNHRRPTQDHQCVPSTAFDDIKAPGKANRPRDAPGHSSKVSKASLAQRIKEEFRRRTAAAIERSRHHDKLCRTGDSEVWRSGGLEVWKAATRLYEIDTEVDALTCSQLTTCLANAFRSVSVSRPCKHSPGRFRPQTQ
ncbi:hypothetical protein AYO21_09268 [Fonsecaea monophora]|uniref:Uncharacterized protein n=1 Tax=Fonsecaea monophora TaxID=254056 RepID=A0A177EWV5_9EURO|nr:hypothetical protein AYO21_09268 [Fonsecaea monophora]OAG36537.1 hypothetical protein AYO21_09268 [Fonsecaea monophora]